MYITPFRIKIATETVLIIGLIMYLHVWTECKEIVLITVWIVVARAIGYLVEWLSARAIKAMYENAKAKRIANEG